MIRLILAILIPWFVFFTIGRPIQGIICLILQLSLIGWIPAAIWAVWALNNYNADKKIARAGMGAIASASPTAEKAAVTSAFFVVAYIAISVPVIGLGVMATFTNLTTTGISFAAVMGSLAALALVLLIRRERAEA